MRLPLLVLVLTFFAGCEIAQAQQGSGSVSGYALEWDSKWNLFKNLLGESSSAITDKLNTAYSNYLNGTTGSSGNRMVYAYTIAESYVYAGLVSSNNRLVLSEGQSYGMMIALQMNDQATFDKLWRFAKNYMQHNGQAPYWYYLAWKVDIDSNNNVTVLDSNPASDAELWFAASLVLASNRWGTNSSGIDYAADAQNLMKTMLHAADWNAGQATPNKIGNMFTASQSADISSVPSSETAWCARDQVLFEPVTGFWTDPSYHLPAFTQLFSQFAPSEDRSRWSDIAAKSRTYLFPRACGSDVDGTHPNNSGKQDNGATGLAPGYSQLDGKALANPYINNDTTGLYYGPESWRVIANIAVDSMWWNNNTADFSQSPILCNRLLSFLNTVNDGWLSWGNRYSYSDQRYLGGTSYYPEPANAGHRAGAAAMNAVGALPIQGSSFSVNFVTELWNLAQPNEENDRYYSGNLYMLALLECSGNFRVWHPGDTGAPGTTGARVTLGLGHTMYDFSH